MSLAQAEFGNNGLVPRAVCSREVFQKARPATDHLQQPASGSVIFLVLFQVFGQLLDSRSQQGDLHLRRTGVVLMRSIVLDDFRFDCYRQCHWTDPLRLRLTSRLRR